MTVLQAVEAGGEVIITRRGRPVARVIPMQRPLAPVDFNRADALRRGHQRMGFAGVLECDRSPRSCRECRRG